MNLGSLPGWRASAVGCLGAALALISPSMAQAQSGWSLEFAPVVQASHWREFDAQGARLLREEGVLRGAQLKLQTHWAGVQWSVAAQGVSGLRHYDGQDNAGAAAQTDVQVGSRQWSLAGLYRWSTGFLMGVEAQGRHLKRQLLDVPGGASGYTERWHGDMVWWRLGYAMPMGAGVAQLTGAWAPWARSAMDLDMPGYASTRLRPEQGRAMQVQAGWLSGPGTNGLPGWQWGITSVIEQRCFDRSEAVPLKRLGRLVGVVRQPQTEEFGMSVSLQLQHHW